MKPSEAYMIGFVQGCNDREPDESYGDGEPIAQDCLHAYTDGYEQGRSRRQLAEYTARGFDKLDEINRKAWSLWNINGRNPKLPDPPPASGCRFHYCWMPVDTDRDNHLCSGHGGKDAQLPKKRKS